MSTRKFVLRSLVSISIIVVSLLFCNTSVAQCAFGGTLLGNVTPGGVGQTFTLNNVWGGEQYTLDAVAGCEYTVSTCGGTWDTQITVFDETNTQVFYNDDACGFQSEITFTAASTGAYTIQVNEFNCTFNFSNTIFNVTLNSCSAGCNDVAACNYSSSGTDPSACCYGNCLTMEMFDALSDSWNGAVYTIADDSGSTVASGTLAAGGYGADELCLADGCYSISVGGGSWDSEITWTLTGAPSGPISGAAPVADIEFSLGTACLSGCDDPTACNYISTGNNPADCCYGYCVSVEMFDSANDGWNGANYSIIDDSGAVAASGTMLVGAYELDEVCLPTGCYSITVGGGSWDSEISWTITGGIAGSVSGTAPISGVELNLGGCLGGCDDPTACNYIVTGNDPTACCFSGCVTLDLFDSANDSWNGATYTITNDAGAVVYSGTLASGGIGQEELCLADGCYNINVGGGSWDSEITWTLSGIDSGSVNGGAPMNVDFAVNGDPSCSPPGQIEVDASTYSAEQLISDVFLGDCLEAYSISFSGAAGSIGSFSNGSSIGIEEGIVLTTGSAEAAEGPNNSGSSSLQNVGGSSTHLENLTGETTYDAAVFTFDFVASTTEVTFTYVFASEEYPEFVCLFNDAFGFFVSGPGYAADTNIALVPGTTDYVSIDNVNNNGAGCPPFYPAYYVDNVGGFACQYDGYTTPLEAVITTVPCETYQITIAVADIGDPLYDSAVFLQAQSFNAGINMDLAAVAGSGGQSTSANCEELGQFVFANQGEPFTEETTINFTISGTATSGVDYDALPTSITFQPGQTFATLDVEGIIANLTDVPESITVTLTESCTCSAPPSIDLFICLQIMLPVEWLDFTARLEDDDKHVACRWETASEVNNEYFSVERSGDGLHWEVIGEVAAGGNPNFVQSYTFLDHDPLIGVAYYRIRQNDVNGEFDYSVIRSVEKIVRELSVFPNPGNGTFKILGYSGESIAIHDARGREIDFELSQEGELNLVDCSTGTYMVKFWSRSDDLHHHIRLIVE